MALICDPCVVSHTGGLLSQNNFQLPKKVLSPPIGRVKGVQSGVVVEQILKF